MDAREYLGPDRFSALRQYLSARPGMIQDGDKHHVHPRDLLLNADVLNLAVAMAPTEAKHLSNICCYWEFGGKPKPGKDCVSVELLNDGKVYGTLEFIYGAEPMQAKFSAWPDGVDKTDNAKKLLGHMVAD